eukprot:168259-Pleurochrysis_carterae.AAC.2
MQISHIYPLPLLSTNHAQLAEMRLLAACAQARLRPSADTTRPPRSTGASSSLEDSTSTQARLA